MNNNTVQEKVIQQARAVSIGISFERKGTELDTVI